MSEFGLVINDVELGYVEKKPRVKNLHLQKSKAGKIFHSDRVKSVCVFDEAGTACLYLNKTPNGVVREEREPKVTA